MPKRRVIQDSDSEEEEMGGGGVVDQENTDVPSHKTTAGKDDTTNDNSNNDTSAPPHPPPTAAAVVVSSIGERVKNRLMQNLERNQAKAAAAAVKRKREKDNGGDDGGKKGTTTIPTTKDNESRQEQEMAIPKKKKLPEQQQPSESLSVIPKKSENTDMSTGSLLSTMKGLPMATSQERPRGATTTTTTSSSRDPNTSSLNPTRTGGPHRDRAGGGGGPSMSPPRQRSKQPNATATNDTLYNRAGQTKMNQPRQHTPPPPLPRSATPPPDDKPFLQETHPVVPPPTALLPASIQRNIKLEQMVWDTLNDICENHLELPASQATPFSDFLGKDSILVNSIDMSGSLMPTLGSFQGTDTNITTKAKDNLDFFELDEEGCIILHPPKPMFPDDFDPDSDQKPYPLSWFGIVDPPVEEGTVVSQVTVTPVPNKEAGTDREPSNGSDEVLTTKKERTKETKKERTEEKHTDQRERRHNKSDSRRHRSSKTEQQRKYREGEPPFRGRHSPRRQQQRYPDEVLGDADWQRPRDFRRDSPPRPRSPPRPHSPPRARSPPRPRWDDPMQREMGPGRRDDRMIPHPGGGGRGRGFRRSPSWDHQERGGPPRGGGRGFRGTSPPSWDRPGMGPGQLRDETGPDRERGRESRRSPPWDRPGGGPPGRFRPPVDASYSDHRQNNPPPREFRDHYPSNDGGQYPPRRGRGPPGGFGPGSGRGNPRHGRESF